MVDTTPDRNPLTPPDVGGNRNTPAHPAVPDHPVRTDEVAAKVFGCSQSTITWYHEILTLIPGWVTRTEVGLGEREDQHVLFAGQKHVPGQNVQVIADVGDPVNGARHDAGSPPTSPA